MIEDSFYRKDKKNVYAGSNTRIDCYGTQKIRLENNIPY